MTGSERAQWVAAVSIASGHLENFIDMGRHSGPLRSLPLENAFNCLSFFQIYYLSLESCESENGGGVVELVPNTKPYYLAANTHTGSD